MGEVNEDQRDEIEALQSIFEDDFCSIRSCPPCFMITLTDLDVQLQGQVLHLKVTFPSSYPEVPPVVEFPMRHNVLPEGTVTQLVQHLEKVALDNIGMAMTFTLVEEAKTWLNENAVQASDNNQTVEEGSEDDEILSLKECNVSVPKMAGGRWDYVIGLVGKPSAGKSTFFNAATAMSSAKTAAHPFTTIEPNYSKAFYSIPCPCRQLCNKLCDAAYGHNFEGKRQIPLLLKDVAGLIPGASEGKGLGNRFLNDLLDADVFMHILDISGKTNEKGEQTDSYDPYLDVQWLQMEIHKWIFDNVMAKWDNILKKPSKLIDMFTGYHANKSMIHTTLVNAGIDPRDLSSLPTWKNPQGVVGRVVHEFLLLRFPMLLVLNKCDVEGAEVHIKRLQEKYPHLPSIEVSALSEVTLQNFQKSGAIQYEFGSTEIRLTDMAEASLGVSAKNHIEDIRRNIIDRHGSTNVHNALCKAVSLRSPSYVYPVQCFDTLKSANKRVRETRILHECVSLKPMTTVEEAFITLKHYPTDILTGDFVRAETIDASGNRRQVRKDEVINDCNKIMRFMTTKRTH